MQLSQHQAERIAREMEGYFELELYGQALERARTLIAADAFLVKAKFSAGECLKMLGSFQEAVDLFQRVLDGDPSPEFRKGALLGLAWCAKRIGRLDRAIECLETLCRRFPEEPIGPYNLACYYALDGRRDQVIDLLHRAIRMESAYRELARKEEDFLSLREDPEFRSLIQGEPD